MSGKAPNRHRRGRSLCLPATDGLVKRERNLAAPTESARGNNHSPLEGESNPQSGFGGG